VIAKNPAFTLNDSEQRDLFAREYKKPLGFTTKDSRISISYLTASANI